MFASWMSKRKIRFIGDPLRESVSYPSLKPLGVLLVITTNIITKFVAGRNTMALLKCSRSLWNPPIRSRSPAYHEVEFGRAASYDEQTATRPSHDRKWCSGHSHQLARILRLSSRLRTRIERHCPFQPDALDNHMRAIEWVRLYT